MKRLTVILAFLLSFAFARAQGSVVLTYTFYEADSSADVLERRAANFFRWNHSYHHYSEFVWVKVGHQVGD